MLIALTTGRLKAYYMAKDEYLDSARINLFEHLHLGSRLFFRLTWIQFLLHLVMACIDPFRYP